MTTLRFLLYGAIGVTAVLLLTSDRAKAMRDDLEDKAMDGMDKLKTRLGGLAGDASDKLSELKDLLSSEIEGLGDDARKRIETVLNGPAQKAGRIRNRLANTH